MSDSTRVTIYHNPRCQKSRETLTLLRDAGIEPTVVEYLKTPPTQKRIKELIELLGVQPHELLRKKEAPYKELGLGRDSSAAQVARAVAEHPVLLERPVVVVDDAKAALGRPPEKVRAILPS